MDIIDHNETPRPDNTGKILGLLGAAAYLTAATAGIVGALQSWKAWSTLQEEGAPDAEVFAMAISSSLIAQLVTVIALAAAIALQRFAFSRFYHPKWLWWTTLASSLLAAGAAIMPTSYILLALVAVALIHVVARRDVYLEG